MNPEIIIEPRRSWFYVDWQGLVHYRDLLFLLVRREFISKYKQTVLGPLWFILQPLLTTIVFTIVFGKIARIPTDGIPPILFYLCGMTAWSYFAQCLGGISLSLTNNANLFSKVYFPRIIVPLSMVLSSLYSLAIQLITFLSFYLYFKYFTQAGGLLDITRSIYLIPCLILQTAMIGLGVGLWIAALTVKYRDFQHLVTFMIQLWMYATPVIYPMSAIPKHWHFVALLNPMTSVVELYRRAFFGTGLLDYQYLAVSIGLTFLTLFSGLLIFNRVERTFVDSV